MKKQFILFICIVFSLNALSQSRYIQKKDGEIVKEKTFYKQKNEFVAKIKKELAPEKYFDIIYEFEKPIRTNDSIIIKVSKVIYSSYPPKMNIKNVFNEEVIKGELFSIKSLQTIEGDVITVDDLIGKPTIVNFWHTACGPCIKEMPILNQIKKEYEGKVNFIAITFETKEKVEKFLNVRKFEFTHIINAADFMNSIQIKEFPKTFYLDKAGIVKKIEGAISDEQKKDSIEYISTLL